MRRAMLRTLVVFVDCLAEGATQNCSPPVTCFTKACVSAADEMVQAIDLSVDPCDDFYQYACGGWMQKQFLTPESERVGFRDYNLPFSTARKMLSEPHRATDLDAEKKAKTLYRSCLQHDSGSTEDAAIVNAVSERFGGWPLACGAEVTGYDLESFLLEATQIGVFPLFQLHANPRMFKHNTTTKTGERYLYFGLPVLAFPADHYASFEQEPEYRNIYADIISAAARKFNADCNIIRQDALDVVAVEENLGRIFRDVVRADTVATSLDYVDTIFGQLMNWTRFVNTLAALPNIGILDIPFDETVFLAAPYPLDSAIEYFLQLPERTQVNYIIWRVVESLQNALINPYSKLDAILQHAVTENDEEPFREEACTYFVMEAFHLVFHRLMYGTYSSPEKLQQVEEMLTQMKQEFKSRLRFHRWLDDETTQFIKDKIDSVTTLALYRATAMDNATVEAYYSNVTIDESNFTNNVIATRKDDFEKNFQTIRIYMKLAFEKVPPKLSERFNRFFHEITYTSTMFHPPENVDDASKVLTYAGIGFVFAHEMAHAFDREGSRYHSNGTFGNFWNRTAWNHFIQRTSCVINQYNRYLYKASGQFVNGALTLNENLADHLGVELSYWAHTNYTRWITPRELNLPGVNYNYRRTFFLRTAQMWCRKETRTKAQQTMIDTHSPPEFRVNGPFQNMEEFSRIFECPLGSRMNTVNKCPVWY